MSHSFASLGFEEFHAVDLPQRMLESPTRMPESYTRRLRPLGIQIRETGASKTYRIAGGGVAVVDGHADAETLIEISHDSWQEIVHDLETAPGLIYGQRVRRIQGDLMQLIEWEPALRWMFTGRPVFDPDHVDLRDASGAPLDPTHGFDLEDDPEEMAHFLRTAGYLWVRSVLSAEELDELRGAADRLQAAAREGDQESWWGKCDDGSPVLCRVLRAGKEPCMAALHSDARLRRLVSFCDVPMNTKMGPQDQDGVTVLWKRPGVEEGLANLPWHRDCGLGGHASMCPTAVLSVFLGPNTPEAGQLSFLPGSWQKSYPFAEAGDSHAPEGVAPPAQPGDVTLHYGDGLHVAPAPTREEGPHRSCVLIGFARADGGHHRGQRHYNDALLGADDGQIDHMSKLVSKS